jgi:hypothetical protein
MGSNVARVWLCGAHGAQLVTATTTAATVKTNDDAEHNPNNKKAVPRITAFCRSPEGFGVVLRTFKVAL